MKEHGQQAMDGLIAELKLDQIFGFRPGTRFEGGFALDPVQNRRNKKQQNGRPRAER